MARQHAVHLSCTSRRIYLGKRERFHMARRSLVVGDTSVSVRCSEAPEGVQLLTDAPQRFIGPLRVCEIDGKGRGVVATQAVDPGQLLMCCNPLGVVTGPQQASLSVEELQVALASNHTSSAHWWLHQLYDGSDASAHQEMHFQQTQPATSTSNGCHPCPLTADAHAGVHNNGHSSGHQHQHQRHAVSQHTHSSSSTSSSANSSCSGGAPHVTDAVLQLLMDVVRYNAYGDRHDDLAAAALTGAEPVALLGLWPEFSMFNHSCAPNAINWVLPGGNRAMVVRAARHIQPGAEVTISYLGGPQLLPLDARQDALSSAFGFRCTCHRCQAEEDIPDTLTQQVQDTVSRVAQSFAPQVGRAMQSGDKKKLQEVRRQAAATMTLLYQQFRRHLIHPVLRDQLLASCYNCLEVIADADAALGDTQAEAGSLAKCLKAAAAVTPGSDLHVIVASKLAAAQQEMHGADSKQARQAWEACIAAHYIRYGQLDVDSIMQLAQLNRTLYV